MSLMLSYIFNRRQSPCSTDANHRVEPTPITVRRFSSPRFWRRGFTTKHAIAMLDSALFDLEKFRVPPSQFLWRLSWPFRPAAREKCIHLFPGFLDGEPRRLL